jgi:hypothetical protein
MLNKIKRYQNTLNSHDIVKFIGITTMVIDHIGLFLFPKIIIFRIIGRLAAPCFFFLIGYVGAYRFKLSLLLSGLWLTGLFMWFQQYHALNLLLSFILLRFVFHLIEFRDRSAFFLSMIFFASLLIQPFINHFLEYGTLGFLIATTGRLTAIKHPFTQFFLLATFVAYFIFQAHLFTLAFPDIYFILLGVLILVQIAGLSRYSLRPFKFIPTIDTIFMLISRYSLFIYVVSTTLFFLPMIL